MTVPVDIPCVRVTPPYSNSKECLDYNCYSKAFGSIESAKMCPATVTKQSLSHFVGRQVNVHMEHNKVSLAVLPNRDIHCIKVDTFQIM